MRALLAILCFGLLSGCDDYASLPIPTNAAILSGKPALVGTLPDGRNVFCYVVAPPYMDFDGIRMSQRYGHTIYVVDSPDGKLSSLTINRGQSTGKTSTNMTEVIINGMTYVPKAPSTP